MTSHRQATALPAALLAISMAAYIFTFGTYVVLKHMVFGDSGFDLGIHDQGLWLLSQGLPPFNTVRGLHQFGDHVWFIMVLLTPLYWIWADVRFLLFFQTVACALGALPVYLMAREQIGSRWPALALAMAYLLYPALGNVNLDHFHPEVLATPLLLAAFHAASSGRHRSFALFTGLALLCKEDVSIVVALMGLYLLSTRKTKLGVITMLGASFWLFLCLKVFLPYFNGYGFFRHESGYWFSGIMPRLTDPTFLGARFFNADNGYYLLHLLAPAGFLPLLSPSILAISLAPIAINILSGVRYLRSIDYHYTVNITPFIFAATVFSVSRFRNRRVLRALMAVLVLGAAAAGNVRLSKLPFHTAHRRIAAYWTAAFKGERVATVRKAISLIPERSGVAADPFSVPHLTHRRYIYEFPNPFMPVYWGIHGENPHDPALVQYILLKGRLHPRTERLFNTLKETELFKPMFLRGDIRLLKRNPKPPSRAYGLTGRFYPLGPGRLPGQKPVNKPLWEGLFPVVEFPPTRGNFRSITGQGPPLSDAFAAVFSGFIAIGKEGEYRFNVTADDGVRLSIDGMEVLKRAIPGESSSRVRLQKGRRRIVLEYFEVGGIASLVLSYRPPGAPMQVVPARVLFPQPLHRSPVAAGSHN